MSLGKILAWVGGLVVLALLLFVLEASGGHDGYLCDWGYDKDGDRQGVSGCA
jgi:hypothetical protein